MKKILTIDFDIIMNPSIDIYNDSDLTADEYLTKFDFLGTLVADLELYKQLTLFLNRIDASKIHFIEEHDEVAKFILAEENNEKVDLYNIDYHHDLGYGKVRWFSKLIDYDEGNWVKKLWDENRLNRYIWLNDLKSSKPPKEAKKFLTEEHFIKSFPLESLIEADECFICWSPEWVPGYYDDLYSLWKELF